MQCRLSFRPKWIILKLEKNHCVFNIRLPRSSHAETFLCHCAFEHHHHLYQCHIHTESSASASACVHACIHVCRVSFLLMRCLLLLLYLLSGWIMLNKVFSSVCAYCVVCSWFMYTEYTKSEFIFFELLNAHAFTLLCLSFLLCSFSIFLNENVYIFPNWL